MDGSLRVLMVTCDWPTPGRPRTTHFIKRQAEFVAKAGVEVEVFAFQGEKRLMNYAAAWWRLRRKLARGRYDLVHAQFGQSAIIALPKRLPLVVTLRGSDILGIVSDRTGRHTLQGRVLRWVSRLVAARAESVIVVSDHMRRELPPGVGATVIPSGLNLELFRPIPRDEARRRLGLRLDERLVLFAGRPHQARKRFDLAQRAVNLLDPGLQARMLIAWGIEHAEMPLYMNAADVLIHTSMQEGSPNVVKEALACNLPVVSVPVGDVEERLAGVEGCEMCRDETPEALASALERVLLRGERSTGRVAIAGLDETLLTQRVLGCYREALARAGGRTRTATVHQQVVASAQQPASVHGSARQPKALWDTTLARESLNDVR